MKGHYIPRIVDPILEFRLRSKGAVWIRGPKWCGKSTTAERFAKTVIRMQDEDYREQYLELARLSPSEFLSGETPVLVDEWQVIPFIWNQIRTEVDKRDEFGQFILTGSKQPEDSPKNERYQHSGTGRIGVLTMRTLSLFESGESDGRISLKSLFEGKTPKACKCEKTLRDYAFYTARGGWPKAVGLEEDIALQQSIDYIEGLVHSNISFDSESEKVTKRDPSRVRLLLRSYSRNCSTQANYSTIREDMRTNDLESLDTDTIASYIKALTEMYVLEESKAWNPNLRSKTAIRTSNTRYFTDPSLACASLDVGPDGLIGDLKLFGLLFENLCIRDLRTYAEAMNGEVKHYRDASNLEVDAVITLRNGDWAAIEVKLGSKERIEEGVNNLHDLVEKLDPKMRRPRFMMILTTTNVSYVRDDGIMIVPLGNLGP